MLFNSLQFLFFIAPVFALYFILPHKWQNRLLIVASCIFYAAWNWKFLAIMFFSVTIDFFCAQEIDSSSAPDVRKKFLFISVATNLLILGVFKYYNFFMDSFITLIAHLHPGAITFAPLYIILPLGISFYTFEAISYVVDVYRGQAKPCRHFGDYLLFIIYFPHLIAGPIMRAKNFLPQITQPRKLSLDQFYEGCFWFFWGLFEKLFVADNLAAMANPVFAQHRNYEGGSVLLALYAFSFQILCDFDGYSNMARGLGKCFGFDIPINFKLPYFAMNPSEFWHRWHITLSTWFRDYLYIPLGGNRKGEKRMYIAILLTMVLAGLWHGAAWTFIAWGLYHAILLIIHRFYATHTKPADNPSFLNLKQSLKLFFFFHFIALGWVLFRSSTLFQAFQMISGLLFHFNLSAQDPFIWLQLACIILPFLSVQIWQHKTNDLIIIYKQHWLFKTFIYAFLTYLILHWGVMNGQKFVYFQF